MLIDGSVQFILRVRVRSKFKSSPKPLYKPKPFTSNTYPTGPTVSVPLLRCLCVSEQSCSSCSGWYGSMARPTGHSKQSAKKGARVNGPPAPPAAPNPAPAAAAGGLDLLAATAEAPVPAVAVPAVPDAEWAWHRVRPSSSLRGRRGTHSFSGLGGGGAAMRRRGSAAMRQRVRPSSSLRGRRGRTASLALAAAARRRGWRGGACGDGAACASLVVPSGAARAHTFYGRGIVCVPRRPFGGGEDAQLLWARRHSGSVAERHGGAAAEAARRQNGTAGCR